MFPIPAAAEPLVQAIQNADVFTRPTVERFIQLMMGLIVTAGRHTVSRALRIVQPLIDGHWCNYHRLYSQARFSMWQLGLALTRQVVVGLLAPDEPIILIADDTVDGKDGDHVWAKGAWRDPTRSTRSRMQVRFGHKWLVLCILVQLPLTHRPWALPVLCGMCCSEKVAKKAKCRPRSASQVTLGLLQKMMRWFPARRFILLADARAVSHYVACFAHQHRRQVTLISRMRSDANLYDPPANPQLHTRGGRCARKGRKQKLPRERVDQLPQHEDEIAWYGSSRRKVKYQGDSGSWFNKHGHGARHRVVPIRWVCVRGDKKQQLEDAYFYSTDLQLQPKRIIELYAMRWNIEVTFEEAQGLLGLETTRHWCRQSVLRAWPILLGLFTVVSLIWKELSKNQKPQMLSQTPCYQKQDMTFADVLYLVRRELWQQSVLSQVSGHQRPERCLSFIPEPLRSIVLNHLAAAA